MALTAPVTDGLTRWLKNEAPAAVAGYGGHDATFAVSCGLWRILNDEAAVWARLQEYNNTRCSPSWSVRALRHKLEEGDKATAGDPKRVSRSRSAPGMTRKARGSSPGDIRAALSAPPRKYAMPGHPALPRPAPRPREPTALEKRPQPVPELVAEDPDRDKPYTRPLAPCPTCGGEEGWSNKWVQNICARCRPAPPGVETYPMPRPAPPGVERERIPFWDELMAANSDILKCVSCPKRRDFERWCDRHPRAMKYHPTPTHPCIRPEVTAWPR